VLRYGGKMKKDIIYICLLLFLVISIPLAIRAYDRSLKPDHGSSAIKEFVLTGHALKGWMLQDVTARDMLSFFKKKGQNRKPVIRVQVNDSVVIKLRSADVMHGFALKGYGIYIAKGIAPGSTSYVKFKADKPGTFVFACTVFCGDIHHAMQGTLVVEQ